MTLENKAMGRSTPSTVVESIAPTAKCGEEQHPEVLRNDGVRGVRTGERLTRRDGRRKKRRLVEAGVRGATAGCREASEGSCAAKADGGVDGSSVAGTGGGEGDENSSPGSDEVITAMSVAGGEMGSRDAETYVFVAGLLV